MYPNIPLLLPSDLENTFCSFFLFLYTYYSALPNWQYVHYDAVSNSRNTSVKCFQSMSTLATFAVAFANLWVN